MKILITGGSGQLGHDCNEILTKKHEVLSLSSREINITRFKEAENVINKIKPDILINCAAFTKVDACETEKELAWGVNAKGPEHLAEIIEKLGSKLIHISTDYVFNGEKKPPASYVEKDDVGPLSNYGKSKLEGEQVIIKKASCYTIIRSSWIYGIKGSNFLKTILKIALNKPQDQIKVVHDQYGSPTWSRQLALQIDKIIEKGGNGIYHATSEGYCTWFELAKYFLEKMAIPHNIVPCSTEEYPTPARRPANSILENQRLNKENINLMKDWKGDIDIFVESFRECLINEVSGNQ